MERQTIQIEKYTEGISQQSEPLTGLARAMVVLRGSLQSFLRHTIHMFPNANNNPVVYSIARGALLLEFAFLRLRLAVPAHGEHDMIITENELAEMAERIWQD